MGQWLSVPMILAGLGLWIFARKRALSDVEDGVDNSGITTIRSRPGGRADGGAEVLPDKDLVRGSATTAATEAAAEPSVDPPLRKSEDQDVHRAADNMSNSDLSSD